MAIREVASGLSYSMRIGSKLSSVKILKQVTYSSMTRWCIPSGDHLERRPIEPDKGNNSIILLDWVVEHWRNDLLTKAADMRILNRCSLD